MKATNSPPVMGLAEAAQACGVSVSTIRRKRAELVELGAAQTGKGWHIPVTALIALGLMPATTDAPSDIPASAGLKPVMTPPVATPNDALLGELEALRAKLVEVEQRAAVAEAVAAERERIIHVQDMALRMLEAPKPQPATVPPETPTVPVAIGPAVLGQSTPDTTKGQAAKPAPLWRRLLSR